MVRIILVFFLLGQISCDGGSFIGNKVSDSRDQSQESSDAEAANPELDSTNGPEVNELDLEEVPEIQIVDIDQSTLEGRCGSGDEDDDERGQILLNSDNERESYVVETESNLLVNGNNNIVEISFSAEKAQTFCTWVNGNSDQVLIKPPQELDSIALGINGNNGTIILRLGPNSKITTVYRYIDGNSSEIKVERLKEN